MAVKRDCIAIRHVPFEDLGSFGPALAGAGFEVRYVEAGLSDLAAIDLAAPDLAVILGGPIGVYELDAYPFLRAETAIVRARLDAGRATLGLCLGAQVMCAALGAQVAPGAAKEIGYAPVRLSDAGAAGPLRHLAGVPVLHWHGDQMTLPAHARCLASTTITPVQGWASGHHALALQFHPEADVGSIEQWLVGHAVELAGAGIDPRRLRADAQRHAATLEAAGAAMLGEWLEHAGLCD